MLKFEKTIRERDILAARLSELTGGEHADTAQKGYMIDCNGSLLVDEERADAAIVATLIREGLITGGEIMSGQADETERSKESTEEYSMIRGQAGDRIISFPIGNHTGTSLRNLVYLIYSRGMLLSRATRGNFGADEALVEVLRDDVCTYTRMNFFSIFSHYEAERGKGLYGVQITRDEVMFTGFGRSADREHQLAYGNLAAFMNRQALNQKRIQAKHIDDANEKYAMRIWMMRMGMIGPHLKRTRAILMENLDGHTAYRTAEKVEQAKEKARKRRAIDSIAKQYK